jgi:hypothetical protein
LVSPERRPEQLRVVPVRPDGVLGLGQLGLHLRLAQLGQVRVRPAVVADPHAGRDLGRAAAGFCWTFWPMLNMVARAPLARRVFSSVLVLPVGPSS